ncbi:hypothetical protein CEP54_016150 [Fusarium duplospermum]|uniref:Uncharacterized protein n=1 Tax=Fusarium duplospermum TaxID=1325734 RepID=A0A428NHM7_9HYPO|nr:hypothetical protein CEP54_016150 [Fusarium duplospermum]
MSNSNTRSPIMASDDGPPVNSEPLDAAGVRNDDQRSNSENGGMEWEETIRSSLRMLKDLEARIVCIAARYDVKLLAQEDDMSSAEWARRLTWAVEEIAEEFLISATSTITDSSNRQTAKRRRCLVDAFHGLKHEFLPVRGK